MVAAKIPLFLVSFQLLMLRGYSNLSSQGHFVEQAALFVFGDSLYDPGNNNYINTTPEFQANFWPYGISYFDPPSGRFSDGRLIPDFIAEYEGLPLIPTYLDPRHTEFVYGANFASGGAGALVETHAGFVVNLKTQLQYFGDLEKHFRQNLGDSKTDQLLSDAVYLFSCGGNDYLSPVGNNESVLYPYTHEQYIRMVIGNITDVFKGIHEKGGRKIGITTVAPLACWPSIRAGRPGNTCNGELDIITSMHNQQLSKKLAELEKVLDGFMYSLFDLNTEVSNRMKNPSKYGFKIGDSACCGSGPFGGIYSCGGKRGVTEFDLCDNISDYFFFDSNHNTEVAAQQFAELFWDGDSTVTAPYSLKKLFLHQGADWHFNCLCSFCQHCCVVDRETITNVSEGRTMKWQWTEEFFVYSGGLRTSISKWFCQQEHLEIKVVLAKPPKNAKKFRLMSFWHLYYVTYGIKHE